MAERIEIATHLTADALRAAARKEGNRRAALRLMAIANNNHDLGELWEFSDTGYEPVDITNEAYKFGVNYVVYAMTH